MRNQQLAENWKIFPLGDTAVINIRGIYKEGGRPKNRIFLRADYADTEQFKAAIEKYAEGIKVRQAR